MSIGVTIAATIIIIWPEATIADPICTFIFSIIVCITVTPIVKRCILVLMEGSPPEININELYEKIKNVEEGLEIHDFHLWSISVGKYAMSAHVKAKNQNKVLKDITDICNKEYNLDHLTIQVEDSNKDN